MKTYVAILLAGALLSPISAVAQSSAFDQALDKKGVEGVVSLTIPFGASSKITREAPRLELVARSYKKDAYSVDWALSENFYEERIGFTLSQDPDFLINGGEFQFPGPDEQLDIDAVGALGTAASIGILGYAVYIILFED